jgi:hypothetical protein
LKIDENRVPLRSPRISKDIFKGFSITIILLAVGWQFGKFGAYHGTFGF